MALTGILIGAAVSTLFRVWAKNRSPASSQSRRWLVRLANMAAVAIGATTGYLAVRGLLTGALGKGIRARLIGLAIKHMTKDRAPSWFTWLSGRAIARAITGGR